MSDTWADVRQTREARDEDLPYAHLETSLEATLLHEFGHVFGFGHIRDESSVMGGYGPANAGGKLSISEFEYNEVTALKSHSSTGNNLSLSLVMPTWVEFPVLFHAETWDGIRDPSEENSGKFEPRGYTLCKGDEPIPADEWLPPIHLLHLGTAQLDDVLVRWRLYPEGGSCTGSSSHLLGARTVQNLNSNTPYEILPASSISAEGIPAATYRLCAIVDPLDTISETDPGDNIVRADASVHVLPASDSFCQL